jgi:hypothetical protein
LPWSRSWFRWRSGRTPGRRSRSGWRPWAFLLIVFRLIKGYRERVVDAEKESREPTPVAAHRLLVLANDELEPADLLAQVRLLGSDRYVEAYVVVPKNPIDTGTAEFARAASIRAATIEVAQARLDEMVRTLRHAGVPTEGRLGDFSPAIALEEGVGSFRPDSILVVRNSEDAQMLVPNDVVAQARESLCIPVYSVIGRLGCRPVPIHIWPTR